MEDALVSSITGPICTDPRSLPIYGYGIFFISFVEKAILYALELSALLFLSGQTGSGKSTRTCSILISLELPQILLNAGYGSLEPKKSIVITQPRKLSAISLAQRVSQERGSRLGVPVGYSVRWKEVGIRNTVTSQHVHQPSSERTSIWFKTDGVLLREILGDPLLSSYSVIIVDEVHERTSNIDMLLAILKRILCSGKRPDLKVIICSATLQFSELLKFFSSHSSITMRAINIPTRMFPLLIHHVAITPPINQLVTAVIQAIHFINRQLFLSHSSQNGSILVFLPGRTEIYAIIEQIKHSNENDNVYQAVAYSETDQLRGLPRYDESYFSRLELLPLHAGIDNEMQEKIFSSPPMTAFTRRVILSTNVAETSITIEHIVAVIDSGLFKQKIYDPVEKIERLVISKISKAQAMQRAGRAGRTQNGQVLRLYTENDFSNFIPQAIPELLKERWEHHLLFLHAIGMENIKEFDFPGGDVTNFFQIFSGDALDVRYY